MSNSLTEELVLPTALAIQNTMALPCIAEQCYECPTIESVEMLLSNWGDLPRPLVIGGGSNVILPEYIEGPVVRISANDCLISVLDQNDVRVIAEAGMVWDDLVSKSVEHGLYGIENLSWIPGSVGASPVQNIGAYGCELRDVLDYVDAFDWLSGKVERISLDECDFAYRDSVFKRQPGRFIILRIALKLNKSAEFKLDYGELKPLQEKSELSLLDVRKKVIEVRQAKLPDPDVTPNTGSFFKNPIVSESQYLEIKDQNPELVAYPVGEGKFKLAAGWLIDQAGWKGRQIDDMRVHDRQALVLTNVGKSTQLNVRSIATQIMEDIQKRYGVLLEIEPVFVT